MVTSNAERGNARLYTLVAVLLVAVGALGYYAGTKGVGQSSGQSGTMSKLAAQQNGENQPQIEIKPGNPIVAKVDGYEVTRADVFNYIQTLPTNARQLPIDKLFTVAVEQVINSVITEKKTAKVNLDNDPQVKKQLDSLKKNIVRTVYIQNEVEKRVTEDRLKEAYAQYKENFPKIDERKARHILVKEKNLASDLIGQLNGGADFAELAKENSEDNTAQQGGTLGYFSKQDVVSEFAETAFDMEIGTYTKQPVKTEFGYHVILVEDQRTRPVPSYEQAKPFLEPQLRRAALDSVMRDWKDSTDIVRYDINGEQIEPAAGNESETESETDEK